jgi:hypothetical protein
MGIFLYVSDESDDGVSYHEWGRDAANVLYAHCRAALTAIGSASANLEDGEVVEAWQKECRGIRVMLSEDELALAKAEARAPSSL